MATCSRIFDIGDGVWVERLSESVYLLRGYAEGKQPFDQYECVTNMVVSGDSAKFVGFLSKPNVNLTKHREAVIKYLLSLNVKNIVYVRYNGVEIRERNIRI